MYLLYHWYGLREIKKKTLSDCANSMFDDDDDDDDCSGDDNDDNYDDKEWFQC